MLYPKFNFKEWIEENRHLLKPPVGNKCVWQNGEFIVMVVGGPNARKDYHLNQTPEFFYQVEGNNTLKLMGDGKPQDVNINEIVGAEVKAIIYELDTTASNGVIFFY